MTFMHLIWFNLVASCAAYDRPIIGILTQPLGVEMLAGDVAVQASRGDNYTTFISASYVKFAEASGARVVPLHYDAPEEELRFLFSKINGIIFPGGGTEIRKTPGNRFRESAELLYNLSLDANINGDTFPVHGTCLGMQMLTLMASQNDSIMCSGCYDSVGTPLPLEFTADAKSSRLFRDMSPALFNATSVENLTENSHVNGIVPAMFDANEHLKKFFTVLSTNVDTKGKQFVSTFESKDYPITASQWHPEKNNFEWGSIGELKEKAIPHSANAVALSQHIANSFVNAARRNSHRFVPAGSEADFLIYKYKTGPDPNGYFSEIYSWTRTNKTSVTHYEDVLLV